MNKEKNLKPTRNETVVPTDLYTETTPFTESGYIRNEDEQDWDYNPDGDLEISEELKAYFAEQGGTLRWVRYLKEGAYDKKNVEKQSRKGYTFVKLEQIPLHLRGNFEGSNAIDSMQGFVAYEDLALMITPTWKYEIVKGKIEQKADNQIRTVDDLLHRRTNDAGLKTDSAEALKLLNDSTRSQVRVGGKREVSYAKK